MKAPHLTRVLLIGATGFIGSRILQALQLRDDVLVSILARRPTGLLLEASSTALFGDVTDPASVRRAVRHADAVINAASYVGPDGDIADRVNHLGTLSIIRACEIARAGRLVQISTTAVYGSGPHNSLRPGDAEYRPESPASRSRAAADRAVIAAGGIVIRPNLVHGAGDRWFIPGAARMFKTLGTTIDSGRAQLSTIDVTDLGLLAAAAAVEPTAAPGAYHAACQTPLELGQLLGAISEQIIPLNIKGTSTIEDAVRALEPAGFSPHTINMLGMNHHYESQQLWDLARIPSTGFQIAPQAQTWYRGRLVTA
ncbi:NAD-dependent epimerase/dehydratase family protein [Arthrobacter sp. CG_A4]|uniref:NAD-dependent epimerase/dehydratase family protein n=1 Tax=Arthrobacter sp. CG_A4 TaxID=3071706 RepID=UPI002DFB0C1D|nr:nucleoside-diphosphate-sugar epimerase [Arthrobacter sp. CG_A4]